MLRGLHQHAVQRGGSSSCCGSRRVVASSRGAITRTALPSNWHEVQAWAADEFRREVSTSRRDINLARSCLLVALEEEAAFEIHPELEAAVADWTPQLNAWIKTMGSASTWSLERLDALAAEALALFISDMEGHHIPQLSHANASDSQDDPATAAAAAATASLCATGPAASLESDETAVVNLSAQGVDPAQSLTSTSAISCSGQKHHADSHAPVDITPSALPPTVNDHYASASQTPDPASHPLQALNAINTVLFDRHGYQACNRFGDPRDSHLSSVMERGVGCSAALSLLYLEVAARLGLPMAAMPLEDGRYFVVWPTNGDALNACGQKLVVDPYGCGGLLLVSEVCELFDLESPASLRPASPRQLLAALLGQLRDAHWARGVGCSSLPSCMTQLSIATALASGDGPAAGSRPGPLHLHSMRRALAAVQKRVWLLPGDPQAQLELALVYYFMHRFDDAWIELGVHLEQLSSFTQRTDVPADQVAISPPSLSASSGCDDLPDTPAGRGNHVGAEVHHAPSASGTSVEPMDELSDCSVHARDMREHVVSRGSGEVQGAPLGTTCMQDIERVRLLWEKIRLQLP